MNTTRPLVDYRDMTAWQLEQERQKIVKEIERRIVLARAREPGLHAEIQTNDIGER